MDFLTRRDELLSECLFSPLISFSISRRTNGYLVMTGNDRDGEEDTRIAEKDHRNRFRKQTEEKKKTDDSKRETDIQEAKTDRED